MSKPDWRTLPRKPAADRRSAALTIRLTHRDLAALRQLAQAAGLPVSRYLVQSALSRAPD